MSSIERDHDPTSRRWHHGQTRRRRDRWSADSASLETQLWRISQWRRMA